MRRRDMTTRQIEPQFLFFSVPAWYLLSWDRLRDDIRTFRIDRIHRATVMDTDVPPARPAPVHRMGRRGGGNLVTVQPGLRNT